jgi:integrase
MASLMQQGDRFYCQFVYQGKRHCFALGKVGLQEAEAKINQADYLLMRIRQGLLSVPAGVNIITFLRFDGKSPQETPDGRDEVTLGQLRDRYLEVHRGSLEPSTIGGIELHFRHLVSTLGERFPLKELGQDALQTYASKRASMKYRGKPISPATIKKELITLRTAWNWGAGAGLVSGRFPALRKVRMAKPDEKPPFRTWQEIARRLALGGLTDHQADELWDTLYLRKEEIEELLAYVKDHATLPWVYPLLCTTAHTGARRSELLRMEVGDVDFAAGTVIVREKKRAHDKRTTRRVSLTPFLAGVLRDWLKVHPGGQYLFCQPAEVARSKKRSKTTGHQSDNVRPSSFKGRMATVRQRDRPAPAALTCNEAHDHFKRSLAGSKWEVLKGFHLLRHSFISCLAAAGVDQRIIDDFVGHQTEEQRRRYRHLIPDVKQQAISLAFEGK